MERHGFRLQDSRVREVGAGLVEVAFAFECDAASLAGLVRRVARSAAMASHRALAIIL
jgi:hypothetical protein